MYQGEGWLDSRTVIRDGLCKVMLPFQFLLKLYSGGPRVPQSVKHVTLELSLGLGLGVVSSSPLRGAYLT